MLPSQKLTQSLTRQSEGLANCGGFESIKSELKGEGEIRSGMATIVFGDSKKCKPEVVKVKMIKEDGAWKMAAH